ncbi:MAG TPA: cupin domain-containing protein [Candidatus Baltobacteraceae bacterium]|nr:cupin domain-containing protein [Candidatus Baltobacteraceae bacterium]
MGRLFGPALDLASFTAHYYERRWLHVERNDSAYFSSVYDVEAFENGLFTAARFAEHAIGLARSEKPPPAPSDLRRTASKSRREDPRPRREGSSQPLDLRALAEAFESGCSLILNEAFAFTPSLNAFCAALERELGFVVRANVYFSPPNAQGFDLHHDTHDTVILQIEGEKSWNVYEPQRTLPLADETAPPQRSATPSAALKLRPGDTLYLPRGTPHEARSGPARSLHVTLGWYQPRLADILIRAIEEAARNTEELRRAVPPGWQHDAMVRQELQSTAGTLLASVARDGYVERALADVAADTVLDGRAAAAGHFGELDALAALTQDTRVQLREDTPFELRDRLFSLELIVPGKRLTLPASYGNAIQRLTEGPSSLRDLDPLLPLEDLEALVKRLVLGGVARIVPRA